MDWICPSCGTVNGTDDTCACGGVRPDYSMHLQVLGSLAMNGNVFNAPVVVNPPAADVPEREEKMGRVTVLLVKAFFWGSVAVVGFFVFLFVTAALVGAFG